MSSYADVRRAACQLFDDSGVARGSGFFVLADGHLVTCHHVVEGVQFPRVHVPGWMELCAATYVEELSNPAADVAVLKIARESPCVQLGFARERIDVLAHGFRPNEQGTEPEGHTFHGRLEPGQVLHTTVERFGSVRTFVTTDGLVQGVSGGPVYDPQLRRVVGVLRAVEGDARAYVIDVKVAVPTLVERNCASVPDDALDELVRVHDVKLVSEGGRPLASLADRDFQKLLSDYEVFGGRREELTRIDRFLEEDGSGYFFVTGYAGFGKTALLAALTRHLKARGSPIAYHFITPRVDEQVEGEACLRNLCTQLLALHQLSAELRTRSLSELRALYGDLLRLPPSTEHSVVVVLDGLDEALGHWEPRADLFPTDIAEGTRVVFSARRMADREWLADLGLESLPLEQVVELGRLDAGGIREAIEASGLHDPLVLQTAVDAVAEISEGDPFYVSDLLVELREHGGDPAGLEHLPVGHNAYLVRWWKEGRASTDKVAFEDLMGTLAVAKGPLRADDLPEVSVEDRLTRANIDELLEKAGRYMAGGARRGYLLSHRRIFALVEDRLLEHIPRYRRALLDWCRSFAREGWPHDTPPYVLAHYADHLSDTLDSAEEADAGRRDLYAVAEDPAFQRAQHRAAPDEPARGLRLLQAALRAAAAADDPVAMMRYMFLHARLIGELSGEQAVLAALKRRDPRLATAAADHQNPARRTLLYLLIAWASVDSGDAQGARKLLERLTGAGDLPRLEYWEGACAAFLLSRLYALPDLVEQLAARVLDGDEERLNLTLGLVAAADPGARAESGLTDLYFARAWSTHVPVETTRGEGAADQLTLARTLVGAFAETYLADVARAALVRTYLRRGDADEAVAVARTGTGDFQVEFLLKVAAHLGTTGRASAALDVFKEAWSASSNLDAQIVVCSAAKDVGIFDQGRALLSSLAEQARQVSNSDSTIYTRDYYLGRIAEALAELNDYSAATAIADELLDARSRDAAMLHVVRAQLAAGLTDDARATVGALELPATRATALAEIARALTGVDQDRARSTALEAARLAEACPDDSLRPHVTAVAEALACVGLDAEARRLAGTLKNDAGRVTNRIAERQAERGDGQAAWHTLSSSRQRASSGLEFASVNRRLLQRGDVEQAIALLRRLEGQEGGGWINLRDITGAIAACLAARGEGEAARARLITAILREDLGDGMTDAFSAHSHDVVLALLDSKAIGPALTVAAGIAQAGSRARALTMVLERQNSGGDPTAAERTRRLTEEAVEAIAPSAERIYALVGLAGAEAPVHRGSARARLEEAGAVVRDLSLPDPWATLSVAEGWARLGDGDAAIRTVAAQTGIDRADEAWMALAGTLDEAHLRQSADAAFEHARTAIALLEGDHDRAYRLSRMGRALVHSGRLGEALDLAREMPPGSEVPKLLATVATGQAKAGDARAARATLLQGQETALRLDDWEHRGVLVRLAKASLEAGDAPLALELASASGPSDVAQIRATRAIARGRFQEALDEVKAMDSRMTDDMLEELIGHALAEGDVQTAWTAVRHLTQDYNVAYGLARIAEHAAGKGEFSTAVETASQVVDEDVRSRALASIAITQARAGHGVAVRTAELIRTDQDAHLPAIAEALGEVGLKEDLKRLLEAIGRSLPAAFAMSRVLVATYPEWAQSIAELVVQLPRLGGSRL